MENVGYVVWLLVLVFLLVAYLILMFNILVDLLVRDQKTSGWVKALWVIFLIGIPYLTAVAYLVTRGQDMAVRAGKEALAVRQGAEAGIGATWGRSSAQEIADAKALLDAGTVTPEEFDLLKADILRRIQSH